MSTDSKKHINPTDANPLLAAGILRHFSYSDGVLDRYAQIKKQGRVVIRIYEHLGELWFEKSWFTNFGRKSGKPVKIKEPEELIKYKGNHWSLPFEKYEWLVNACRVRHL